MKRYRLWHPDTSIQNFFISKDFIMSAIWSPIKEELYAQNNPNEDKKRSTSETTEIIVSIRPKDKQVLMMMKMHHSSNNIYARDRTRIKIKPSQKYACALGLRESIEKKEPHTCHDVITGRGSLK